MTELGITNMITVGWNIHTEEYIIVPSAVPAVNDTIPAPITLPVTPPVISPITQSDSVRVPNERIINNEYNDRGSQRVRYIRHGNNANDEADDCGHNERSYNERSYNERGYNERSHNERSHNERSHNERGYNDQPDFRNKWSKAVQDNSNYRGGKHHTQIDNRSRNKDKYNNKKSAHDQTRPQIKPMQVLPEDVYARVLSGTQNMPKMQQPHHSADKIEPTSINTDRTDRTDRTERTDRGDRGDKGAQDNIQLDFKDLAIAEPTSWASND
jgi:hypothetical protein